ncbi:MAG: LysE family translocator [Myxococcales bacterium]|nr:MAG: LysE family translocator [Myxococcales bacterium]
MAVELLAFAGVMVLGQFSPGPDMILLTRISLAEGASAGYWAATGVACGLCLHALLAIAGTAQLFAAGGAISVALRVFSAAYLLYLAWLLFKSTKASGQQRTATSGRAKLTGFRAGFLCNVLNPKAVVFLAAAMMPFMSAKHPSWWPWLLGAIVVMQGWLLWLLWVKMLQKPRIQAVYARSQHFINLLFALVLSALALKLVWSIQSI